MTPGSASRAVDLPDVAATVGQIDLTWGAATHRGRRRSLNEDAYLAQSPAFFVADGMGGHDAGEVASAAAVDALGGIVRASRAGVVGLGEVRDHLGRAQAAVRGVESSPERRAGTTVAGAVMTVEDGLPYWLVVNLGDSRVYHLAEGMLEQVSVDHSEVQELVDAGALTADEAATHPRRHVVTRALGSEVSPEPDVWLLPVVANERMLVCSDGLTGEVPDRRIAQVLLQHASAQCAADALVQEALDAGGRDNITVVVVDVAGDDETGSTVPRGGVEDDTVPRGAGRRAEESQ
ncbi:serine/threonine protein phosphatase [Paraoerskovia sediminicola]|uniref:Serine/threonine protein phosphatase n=1 Tax=Paraoerskovia sediminicola TaxID=1138587 RepID=A0ABN6X8V7_9CELL|nr:protein phosphatase 2C domain-containing protein [Paraoerskovia sediminicola]BDZ41260.1 serine/threonine protein phosphatase [Paraoerskovia sediminicola]